MSKRVPPPPSDEAPVSSDVVVEIVKKRLAAPRDPPPSGLTGFKPRTITGTGKLDFDERSEPKSTDNRYSVADDDDYDRAPSYRRSDAKSSSSSSSAARRQYDEEEDTRDRYRYDDQARGDRSRNERTDRGHDRAESEEIPKPKMSAEPKVTGKKEQLSKPAKGGAIEMEFDQQAKPQRLTPYDFTPVLNSTYKDLRDFALSPVDPGIIVRCYIERNRSGMNMLYPVFTLCADLEDGTGRELMACRKVAQSMTSHYVFSLKTEDLYRPRELRSRLYLGKLRHISASEYVLFDDGACKPNTQEDAVDEEEDDDATIATESVNGAAVRTSTSSITSQAKSTSAAATAAASSSDSTLYRKELAVVSFNINTRPVPIGVRGCEVGIPAVAAGFASSTEESISHFGRNHKGIVTTFRKARKAGLQNAAHYRRCFIMHEKASKYDPLSSCLVDFKGRANIASVKNFQLVRSGFMVLPPSHPMYGKDQIERDAAEDFILQLGKTTEDCFNMDFKYPLSPLQAFAICIARFDAKLTW